MSSEGGRVRLPAEIRFHRTQARQIVKGLLDKAEFSADETDLELISLERKSVHLKKPLYALLLAIIDDPSVGLAFRGPHAHFFKQSLTDTQPAAGPLRQFDWRGRLELSEEPTTLFPSDRIDLWAIFSFIPPGPELPGENGRIMVEIRQGDRRLATGEGALGGDGMATLCFRAGATILVSVQAVEGLSLFDVRLYYQTMLRTHEGKD